MSSDTTSPDAIIPPKLLMRMDATAGFLSGVTPLAGRGAGFARARRRRRDALPRIVKFLSWIIPSFGGAAIAVPPKGRKMIDHKESSNFLPLARIEPIRAKDRLLQRMSGQSKDTAWTQAVAAAAT